ncbi:MAG: hypothetical protein KF866_12580 [Phycisphaeraceae bacterium]|nr:hypothetical protein [Phycisphaeraceae bacterium]MCW5754092.1 hypothetical protein [Phycisphaeraceae bacterium]
MSSSPRPPQQPDPGKPRSQAPIRSRTPIARASKTPAAPASPAPPESSTRPRRDPALRPKRVRSGVKLSQPFDQIETSWLAGRWLTALRASVPESIFTEGREYAELGQMRSIEIDPGAASAFIQGRLDVAYRTSIAVPVFPEELWSKAADAMADQAVFAAKVLSGDLPESIDELLLPLGVRLLPTIPQELTMTCSCREPKSPEGWCKHLACLGIILAQKLATEPLLVLTLRGMPGDELLDRVRQRRAIAGSVGAVPVHASHLPGVTDLTAEPLEAHLELFWQRPASLHELDLPVAPPRISHPLLRRLGPSPFTESKFPLVGLLATCYEVISQATILAASGEMLEPAPRAPDDDDEDNNA